MVSGAAETRERAELRNRGGAVERRQGRARNRASEKAGWAPEERASSPESSPEEHRNRLEKDSLDQLIFSHQQLVYL